MEDPLLWVPTNKGKMLSWVTRIRIMIKSPYTTRSGDARFTYRGKKRNPYFVAVEDMHDFIEEIYQKGFRDGVKSVY